MPEYSAEQSQAAVPVTELNELFHFNGEPSEFWNRCLRMITNHTGAVSSLLLLKNDDAKWRVAAAWPAPSAPKGPAKPFMEFALKLAPECLEKQAMVATLPASSDPSLNKTKVTAVSLSGQDQRTSSVIVTLVGTRKPQENLERLQVLTSLPVLYQLNRALLRARNNVQHFASTLDLLVLLNREDRFFSAALTICNELASRCESTRASLGWVKGQYIRLKAMSNTEKFERKMEAVQRLEGVMEEAFDQDEEVVYPRLEEASYISRDHEGYARQEGVANICSIPLRVNNETFGVVTLERDQKAFTETDVDFLRLVGDQIARPLHDLQKKDRWLGARVSGAMWSGAKKVFGVQHTTAKVVALIVAALVWTLCFVKMEYRVQAPFTMRSENVSYVPAPFNGYIDDVFFQVGDEVEKGDIILTLDTKDLVLKRSNLVAEKNQLLRELEKARAEDALSKMRVAEAKLEGTKAKLAEIDYRISQAELKAPQSGMLSSYKDARKLKERIGSPVKRGDILLKVADLENLYIEAKVNEKDIEDVALNATGQVAFATEPDQKFDVMIKQVDPVAKAEQQKNAFVTRCEFQDASREDWFRPGMTGLCKVNAGQRRLIWIFTHKTIDFLRMHFWW
jgi:multidrug resistance efflux pump